jgi:hypothetical protein
MGVTLAAVPQDDGSTGTPSAAAVEGWMQEREVVCLASGTVSVAQLSCTGCVRVVWKKNCGIIIIKTELVLFVIVLWVFS